MKKRLREHLPFSIRLLFRRLIVVCVGKSVRIIGDLLNIATANGLDLRRELPWDMTRGLVRTGFAPDATPALPAADSATDGNSPRQLIAQDFLLLMDVIAGNSNSANGSGQRPRTSIIIPVFNKLDYTFQCVRSLLREIDFHETEVIIINNGSEDETARVLSHMPGLVQVINNRENVGFVHACNQGAAVARGEYLVFLNNDTVVQSGWLKHLVETVESDPSVGAVGSMLLYPDGRLQEAGAVIWIDGSGWNYGRGKDPRDKRFTFKREVDYCSGASLLVRRELFEELGGFDRRYAPAYYEDADLCFGIRSLGYKVVYQPLSRIIHYEGITAGTSTESGFKRYQDINRFKFAGKWQSILQQEHLANDPYHVEQAANRGRGPRIMVFDEMIPTPDKDSGSLRMSMILKSLTKIARPVFVPLFPAQSQREYESLLEREGIEIVHRADYKRVLKDGEFFAAILSRPAIADAVLPAIRKIDRNIKIVYDTVDIHFLRLQREYELTKDESFAAEALMLKKQETRLASASDQVWCVTPDDKEVLAKESPPAKITVIPNIHALHERGKKFDEREGILFIGNFNHRPNKDAVHFFMDEINCLIQQAVPGMKFYIVGSYMPDEIKSYLSENVLPLGFVPDVDDLFHQCRVFISPLRYGAGMKGKIGQALSYGLPVVTTAIGAEGIKLRHDHDALIADDAEAFAKQVVRVYLDSELWQKLSDNGYKHIAENFAPPAIEKRIQAAIGELYRKPRPADKPVDAREQIQTVPQINQVNGRL